MPIAYPIFNLQMTLTYDYSPELIKVPETVFTVELVDGPINIEAKWLVFNIHFWKPLIRRNLPITKRHLFYKTLLSKKEIQRINHEIFKDVKKVSPYDPNINHELVRTINDLYNMIVCHLGAYQCSMDAFTLCELLEQPGVKELTKIDVTSETIIGTQAVENKIEKAYEAIVDKLRDGNIPGNVIYPFLKLDLLSTQQLPQVLVALGLRTDVNDLIVTKPILDSFMNGMTNIIDYAIESLSGKKSVFYNRHGMSDSQYSNRKQQLLASSIAKLYPGDCGTMLTIPYYIHENNHKNVVGKYIVENNELHCITVETSKSYVGKIVNMRSPLVCRHTDGICKACGGQLTDYMHPNILVGIASVIELMGPVSQLILSNKHFSRTRASAYSIPESLKEVMANRNNDIFLRDDVDYREFTIGIPFGCMPRIHDLQRAKDNGILNEQYLSEISAIVLSNTSTGKLLSTQINMVDDNDSTPYFTTDMLRYIKNNMNLISIVDEIIWINLSQFDVRLPILRSTIENDSMLSFTSEVSSMFSDHIAKYTSATDAIRDFTTKVYRKVKTNIMHLEVILKASLITSDINYAIPIVTDPDNVKFGTLDNIIPKRAIGSQFAFEGLQRHFFSPDTYIMPKPEGPFDIYIGMSDELLPE